MVSGQTRAIYVEHNRGARLRNHFCSEEEISIIYIDCVLSVALGTQHAMRMRLLYCQLWLVRLSTVFPHYLIKDTIFKTKQY
jgi:hypothetical protein